MSRAFSANEIGLDPFVFMPSPLLTPSVRVHSQLVHGSNVQNLGAGWAKASTSAAIEEPKHSASENEVNYVTSLYSTTDQFALGDYLGAHPYLVGLLVEAYPHLRAAFGTDAAMSIELVAGDEPGEEPEAFGVATVATQVERGLAAMESFDSGWWLEASQRAHGKLNFTAEYL